MPPTNTQFAVKGESAYQLLCRMRKEAALQSDLPPSTGIDILDSAFMKKLSDSSLQTSTSSSSPLPFVEVYGPQGCGKTLLLMHIVANEVLPQTWTLCRQSKSSLPEKSAQAYDNSDTLLCSWQIGGRQGHVVYVDADRKLDMRRMRAVIKAVYFQRLSVDVKRKATERESMLNVDAEEDRDDIQKPPLGSMNEEELTPNEQEVEEMIDECMERISISQPSSSYGLLATFAILDKSCLSHNQDLQQCRRRPVNTVPAESSLFDTNPCRSRCVGMAEVTLIVLDSSSTFHFVDKAQGGSSHDASTYYQRHIASALRFLRAKYRCQVFASKQKLFLPRSVPEKPVDAQDTKGNNRMTPSVLDRMDTMALPKFLTSPHQHGEFKCRAWTDMVTHRCTLAKLGGPSITTKYETNEALDKPRYQYFVRMLQPLSESCTILRLANS